jgi:hypothetical protein
MNADNPWLDGVSDKDLILAREPVTKLTQQIIENLVSEGEEAMRRKDLNGLMSLLAPDFKYVGPEIRFGKRELIEGNRSRFQIGVSGTFATSDLSSYSLRIASIENVSPHSAEVTLVVRNPGDDEFIRQFGNEIKEKIYVSLYHERPVISRLEIESAS